MDDERYDAVIVGSGQGGVPLAEALAGAGWRVALAERSHVGGSCVNYGCTPTKTLVASARVAHLAARASEYGLRAGPVEASMPDLIARKARIVERFRDGMTRGIEASGVELIRGEARFSGRRQLEIALAGGGTRQLEADRIVLNPGARPAQPPVDGLDEIPWLDSTSIMELDVVPDHLVVIGGGYVGLEFGQMFRRFGSRVTIVQRGGQLLGREDEDVAQGVAAILEDDGIDVRLATEAKRARRDRDGALRLDIGPVGGDAREIVASHVLVAAGREPATSDLDLERGGVRSDDRGFVTVDNRLATSAPGVYAIGDATPGPAFTHSSYDDFRIVRANLLGGDASAAGRIVPYAVFIDPQLGRVGLSEREARARGVAYRVARLPASHVARAIEMGETRGAWKVLVSPDAGAILGAAILGVEGAEVMAMLQIAMMGNLPYQRLRDGIFTHPTLAEAMNRLFASVEA